MAGLADALRQFPPVAHAFAYGSSVFRQEGAPVSKDRMVDYILVVDCPLKWHTANLQRNTHHYASYLRSLGPSAVTAVAENIGVGVHFNSYVPWNQQILKYGVVSKETVLRDLREWTSLYIAGRLHKPVAHLVEDPDLLVANAGNLRTAATCALLLLPECFTEAELFHTICGLSYSGDVRMGIAEDQRKVHRIAQGSQEPLRALYADVLAGPPAVRAALEFEEDSGARRFLQDTSPGARTEMIASLPVGMLAPLARLAGTSGLVAGSAGSEAAVDPGRAWEVGDRVAHSPQCKELILGALQCVVAASSRRQAVSGALAAGSGNAMRYLAAKVSKAWKT
uniref:Phosphatidate cytidylyltransferase, mitochondrial n=1 Tax=Pyramimonas obovata TaxID=1411642 RepID=A0A7S0QSL2_9CHLO|mmetsp:Transcript_18383/g.40195  ORF Transcript_18383/g.40195 Transcript_18383/m.40195 type:complete len:338 (+) Transcript_18383:276-1289(+)